MKLRSLAVGVCAALVLSACKEVQLNGPVGGAEVSLSPLKSPDSVSWVGTSASKSAVIRERGQETWDDSNEVAKSIWLGNVEVDVSTAYPGSLYLITAKYGRDMDANADRTIDTYGLSVSGQWHAIMDREQLDTAALKVTVLTEAAYQYVKPIIQSSSNSQIQAKLDEFARAVVTDIDRNGSVNYLDVLWWSRILGDGGYKWDLMWLNQLADGIARGSDENELARLAQQVYENRRISAIPDPTPTPTPTPEPAASIDSVFINSRVWAQVDLFTRLSWYQINAVCPAVTGLCNGTLNGHDMAGWTWATRDDVNAVFDFYIYKTIGYYPPRAPRDSGAIVFTLYGDRWAPLIFDDGMRQLYQDALAQGSRHITGIVRTTDQGATGYAYMPQIEYNYGYTPASGSIDTYNVQGKSTTSSAVGAWFYRSP